MEATLDRLRVKIIQLGARAFFNPPATANAIGEVEERLQITFPESVRKFYMAFNGGFFADTNWSMEDLKDNRQFETIQWNSNHIMSVEDIKSGFGNRYPDCIPVVHTHTQEFLSIINPLTNGESPVYDAFHECPPQEWGILYNNFEELLNDYINKEGNIKTIAVG